MSVRLPASAFHRANYTLEVGAAVRAHSGPVGPSAMRGFRTVRWGWLATTLALAVTLLALAWANRRRAADAEATLDLGQAQVLLAAVRGVVHGTPLPGLAGALDSLALRHRDDGLRFVALQDTLGRVLARTGSPALALPPAGTRPARPPTLAPAGRRLRLVAYGPSARAGVSAGGALRAPPTLLVLEFEPLLSRRLSSEATDTLILSVIVATTLLAAALFFWRLTLRQEEAERRLAEQRRLGALGEMSAVLAHEIRNPLASLKGHAELLAERLPAGSADRHKAERVVHEAQRLQALTTDLLDFARSGPMDIRPADPVALLRSCLGEVGSQDFTLRVEAPPDRCRLDANRMHQALTNILRNARQASPEGTRPEVTIGRENGSVAFVVRDFGTGIPPGDEQRIFSPFYTTRTSGTGLGLAVAQRVVELHGGSIVAANHRDGGAVFRVLIPAG